MGVIMKIIKAILTAVAIISIINLSFIDMVNAGQSQGYLLSDVEVTDNMPKIIGSPLEDIPTEKVKTTKKKNNKWIWWLSGALLLGGGAAVGLGGSSTDNGDSDPGSVTGSW